MVYNYLVHPYCSRGHDKHSLHGLARIWHSLVVTISTETKGSVVITEGNTSKAVKEVALADAERSGDPEKVHKLHFPVYEIHCVGVRHSGSLDGSVWYEIDAVERLVWIYPVLFIVGVALFFTAPRLSR